MHTSKGKVIVGMSGGVDSSVSALLLQQQGYEVEGLFMKNWDEDDGSEYCTAKEDLADAQKVCDRLGIHLHTANFAAEYWDNVFDHFLEEYQAGRTPNPDVLCNREIKFKVFKDYAELLGCDFIATGHYSRLTHVDGQATLLKGLDNNKDQSYFLHAVSAEQFKNVLFPVGELPKSEVRKIAEEHDLVTHDKKDSTGICFIGERRFKDFLQQYIPAKPGPIKTKYSPKGEVTIGEHSGLMYHTIGQRQGLGIGGLKDFNEDPWFVSEKDLDSKSLYVVQGGQHPDLLKQTLECEEIHWINGAPEFPYQCSAKTRYRQEDQACEIHLGSVAEDGSQRYEVRFEQKQRAITPGQYLVIYQGEHCLGGGVISQARD